MLNRISFATVLSLVCVPSCVGSSPGGTAEDSGSTTLGAEGTSSSSGASTGSSVSGVSVDTTTATSESTQGTTSSGASESTSEQPVDRCPAGDGVDWPGRGAFLTIVTPEDFEEGPLELTCSIERSLEDTELDPETVAALELQCQVPEQEAWSLLHVGVTLPEAVEGLEALVGLEDVTVQFNYGAGHLKAVWTEAVQFVVRDVDGPLVLSQWTNCNGEITAPDNACAVFVPPARIDSTWSSPLPEVRIADVGCGTRPFEFLYPPTPGIFEMGRLALRVDTDEGSVDVLDRHVVDTTIGGADYTFFATELLGEVDDPGVIGGGGNYTHFLRFFIVREP